MTKIINIFNSSSGNNAKEGEVQVNGFNVDPSTITATVPETKSSGTVELSAGASGRIDSLTVNGVTMLSNSAVAATGTFTVDTSITEGIHAANTYTISTAADDEIITIDATVYRWKDTPTQAFDVNLGANDAAALDNLDAAINADGTGDGSDYYTGTTAHPTVAAGTNTNTTQQVIARLQGTASNAEVTTETGGGSWADSTLGGGTGASVAGVAGDTVTIASTVYTFVDTLSEDHASAIAYQVLWVTSDAVALDNFKSAINLTGTIGTDYSTTTAIHATVTATTNGAATQVVAAKTVGYAGNSIATTETGSTLSWGTATLAGGKAANSVPFNSSLNQTATDLAANIDANDTTPNYAAAATTDTVTITASDEDLGDGPNKFVVTSSATTITTVDVNMSGGVNKISALPSRTRQNKADYWKIEQASAATDEFDLPDDAAIGEVITLFTVSAFELRTEVDGDKINDVVDKGYQTTAGDIVRCVKVGAASWIVSSLTLAGAAVTITAAVAAS